MDIGYVTNPQKHDFLLHSMLGLGASHLSLLTPSGYEKAALKHRVLAISALNKHLAKPGLTNRDAEAAFGAMLNLTFQSAYMNDGLIDFLTMVRGCKLILSKLCRTPLCSLLKVGSLVHNLMLI
jgi:hypothetical protein